MFINEVLQCRHAALSDTQRLRTAVLGQFPSTRRPPRTLSWLTLGLTSLTLTLTVTRYHYQVFSSLINQSTNQCIYNYAPWYRGACYSADYAEAKKNVLSRVLNVITDGAVRQFRGSEV